MAKANAAPDAATKPGDAKDVLGTPLTEQERELMDVYQALKRLAARDDLPPCAARNVRRALSSMWQVTNDLDLQFEQLYHLGV